MGTLIGIGLVLLLHFVLDGILLRKGMKGAREI